MKFTDVISATLRKYGVTHAFGLQGGAVVHIFDSLERGGINVIYTLHEQAAGLAGVANARTSSSELGCVVTTTGPGSTNAITGLLAAWNDSIPCIFISGQVRSSHVSYGKKVRQFGTQEAPICEIVKPICKRSLFVRNPGNIQSDLEDLIIEALSGRPGPVWLDIPLEYQWIDVPFDPEFSPARPELIRCDETEIEELCAKVHDSKKPLLVLGNGVRLSRSEDLCRKLVEVSGISFVTTWTGQDLFPTDYDKNLGVLGMCGQKGANKAIFDADLLLCLGTHLAIPHTTTLFETYAPKAKKIIVNNDLDQLHNLNVKFDLLVHGDLGDFLERLLQRNDISGVGGELNSTEYKGLNGYDPLDPLPNANVWNRRITEDAGENSCFVVDGGGTALYAGFQSSLISKSGQRIVCSSGMSAMGTGLAETIGVHFSGVFETIYCIVGDGSFFMNIQDLHTIRQHDIPVIISVINNNGYLAIRNTQTEFQEGRYFGTHPEWGLTLPSVEKISQAFGFEYLKVDTLNDLYEYTTEIKRYPLPLICEVITKEDQDVLFKQKYSDNGDGTFSPIELYDMHP